jgi:hypothetical protein
VGGTRLETLGPSHAKLAALISHYGKAAANLDESETWIQEQSLMCLVYEGIKSGVFSFDYGPKSTFVVQDRRAGRVYLNISQEARAALRGTTITTIQTLLTLVRLQIIKPPSRTSWPGSSSASSA